MAKSNKVAYICFISVIVLLVAALAFSGFTIYKKNQHIVDIKAEITANEAEIKEKTERITGLEEQLSGSEQEKESVKSELEAAKSEKQRLEEENQKLKKEIENLKAKKAAAQAQAASNSAASVSPPVQATAPTGEKVCYLTFDDGPSDRTPEVLDILKYYNVKATFFVINSSKMDYIKRMHEEGHTIGLHCNEHVYEKIYANADAYFADLTAISNTVESLTGVKSTVIRFPGGGSNKVSKKYCPGIMTYLTQEVQNRGYSYFDWNVSSGDAESSTPSYTRIKNNVLGNAKGKNSICVLMHDAASKTTTVQALPGIIEGLIAQGFRFEGLTPESFGYHHSVNN